MKAWRSVRPPLANIAKPFAPQRAAQLNRGCNCQIIEDLISLFRCFKRKTSWALRKIY